MANDTIDLEELYRSYFPKIYNFFFYKLLHREDAEDLTAKTFLKIAEHLHTYHSEKAKAGTWAWRIAENTLIDFYRTQKRSRSTKARWLRLSSAPRKSCANTSRIRSFDAKRLHQLVKGAYIHDSNDFSPEKPGAHRIARSA